MATLLIYINSNAQSTWKGKVIDAVTKEPIPGASVSCVDDDCHTACLTGNTGDFVMVCKNNCTSFLVSYIGYEAKPVTIQEAQSTILLSPSHNLMNEIVVTASRGEAIKRSMAPVAVSSISSKMIQDNKAISADQLLNKISGVQVVSLGNEQHQMSIRQPITTKSLFLYLEDGIPV